MDKYPDDVQQFINELNETNIYSLSNPSEVIIKGFGWSRSVQAATFTEKRSSTDTVGQGYRFSQTDYFRPVDLVHTIIELMEDGTSLLYAPANRISWHLSVFKIYKKPSEAQILWKW